MCVDLGHSFGFTNLFRFAGVMIQVWTFQKDNWKEFGLVKAGKAVSVMNNINKDFCSITCPS